MDLIPDQVRLAGRGFVVSIRRSNGDQSAGSRDGMQVFWKAYLFFCLMLTGAIILAPYAFPQEMEPWGSFDYIQAVLWLVGMVGLYGFAYSRGIGRVVYWKIIFLIILAVDVIYPTLFLIDEWPAVIEESSGEFAYFLFTGWVFVVPFYMALYLYGWRSEALWEHVD